MYIEDTTTLVLRAGWAATVCWQSRFQRRTCCQFKKPPPEPHLNWPFIVRLCGHLNFSKECRLHGCNTCNKVQMICLHDRCSPPTVDMHEMGVEGAIVFESHSLFWHSIMNVQAKGAVNYHSIATRLPNIPNTFSHYPSPRTGHTFSSSLASPLPSHPHPSLDSEKCQVSWGL
jgi:hypothetical protein